jgi:uncharacterized membrane protein
MSRSPEPIDFWRVELPCIVACLIIWIVTFLTIRSL